MEYNVTDNRITLDGYFMKQDERGNIHIYRKGSMEYIDYIGVLLHDEFKYKCKEWLNNK